MAVRVELWDGCTAAGGDEPSREAPRSLFSRATPVTQRRGRTIVSITRLYSQSIRQQTMLAFCRHMTILTVPSVFDCLGNGKVN